jgi:amino acid adenylation domain-containing protein
VTLEALPLTPNGKVDRKALPAPEAGRVDDAADWIAPRTPVEELLASLCSSVLGVERVGAQDNFFALGGHSLLATQLVSRIRDALDVELPLNEVFHTPTVAELAVKCEGLRGGQVSAAQVTGHIPRAPRDGELPLSFGQERFWFLEQMQPGTAALNMHGTVRMEGELDRDAFRKALHELVRRHEVLRTSIPEGEEGQPVQQIAGPESFALAETDLTHLQGSEQDAEWRRIAGEELLTPLDIAAGPLVRTALLKLGDRDHVFLLTLHHMVADAWSLGILWRELATLYQAFSTNAPSPLEELPIQYLDFAAWQRSWLDDDRLEGELAYWTRQLEGVPPLLELPTDHPRPPVQTFNGAELHYALGPELSGALKELAAARGATLFMTLLAGFKAVLQRYSGQGDLVVGTPIAGRTRSEAEGLIGLFANSLVLRTDLSDDPTFGDLLHRVRAVSLDAYANQDLPFERLVQVLHPPRETSHHPLFQVMFVLQNAPTQAHGGFPDLNLRLMGGERVTSQFDLTLYAWEAGPRIVLNAEYKTDLFEEPTIARLLSHLERLLEEAVREPERPLSALPLLTDEERERLLVTWNRTELDYPREATLHGLVEQQVQQTPDAIAAVFEGEQLTYRELDERAARLARQLRAGGVGAGSRVGICLERGLPMLVGLLGALKAGAAYVPLDPSHPEERIGFILSDAAIDALVTQADLVDRLDAGEAAIICLDSNGLAALEKGQSGELPVAVAPDDLAYVIYTSGSTGRPKGVEVHHRGVVNFLASMQREPGLTAEDVLLSVTTMSFDIAVLEVFLPLTVGARVVLVPPEVAADGLRLETALTQSRATVMQATPTTWQILLEARWPGDHRLKALVGGEAWSRALADALLPRCGSLWNMYGPTETTIWSAVQRVEPGPAPVAIGPPIANTQLYVLDQQGAPVPVGVPGELYIGGDGVARGYWNRPELTAERFLEDPFSSAPGGRFYRTGDLVRYRDDRTIQFLGRLDHQVKVRGFRIELGEIEWLLSQHQDVREVVVVAHQFGPDDTRLIGYVALAPESPPEPGELQALLRERLPDYMVPTAFVTLDALPRTPNGKIDRAALPAPDLSRSTSRGEHLPPSTPNERLLAEIWEDLLGVGGVGMQDNFFDLGGHSLLAMRVVARLEKASGVRINPGELILQTLMQVAAVCDAAGAESPVAEGAEPVAAGPAPAGRGRMLGSLRRLFTRKRDS